MQEPTFGRAWTITRFSGAEGLYVDKSSEKRGRDLTGLEEGYLLLETKNPSGLYVDKSSENRGQTGLGGRLDHR